MFRNLIGGIAVGIANIIPGVSGGTMMVVLGIFNRVTESISGIFTADKKQRKEYIIFLLQILIGAAIGLVGFANILTFMFNTIPTQTMYLFIGMILLSIPVFLKSQLPDKKINVFAFIVACVIIFAINYFGASEDVILDPKIPALSLNVLLTLFVVGIIGGFSMILPGVSGSMIILIIGQYHLFKKIVASITTFKIEIFIFLGFIGIGVLIGIVIASIINKKCMSINPKATSSFLLGLVVASTIVLIPINVAYDIPVILGSIVAFIIGAIIVYFIEKIK